MACLMLHNYCIHQNDTSEPRWILEVGDLGLHDKDILRQESKAESGKTRDKIQDWLWQCFTT